MLRIQSDLPSETESTASDVIASAIEVHRVLGPGFRESIYVAALCHELTHRGLSFEREKSVVVAYKGLQIPGQRIDLIVSGCVLLELKSVEKLLRVHHAIVRSYLKTTGLRLGLLMNFREPTLRGAIKRVIL